MASSSGGSSDARAKRLVEYFITVGVGADVQPLDAQTERGGAVKDIRVMAEDAELPLGYEVLTATMFGADARLNRGVWAIAEARTYLCVSREAPGPPITGLVVCARVASAFA
jgi:hypothetical protein